MARSACVRGGPDWRSDSQTRYEIFFGQPEKSCFAVNTPLALLSKNSLHIPTGHKSMSTLSSILSAFLGQLPRSIIVSMVLLCAGAVAQDGPRSDKPQTIVFVCLHGSVKSQVAAAHFNRIAKERGLPLVAVSRGIAVDPNIPASIRQGLAADGLVPPDDVPVPLASADTTGAIEVFAFDEVPNDRKGSREVTYWSDVAPRHQGLRGGAGRHRPTYRGSYDIAGEEVND